jgi:hypothetical protein
MRALLAVLLLTSICAASQTIQFDAANLDVNGNPLPNNWAFWGYDNRLSAENSPALTFSVVIAEGDGVCEVNTNGIAGTPWASMPSALNDIQIVNGLGYIGGCMWSGSIYQPMFVVDPTPLLPDNDDNYEIYGYVPAGVYWLQIAGFDSSTVLFHSPAQGHAFVDGVDNLMLDPDRQPQLAMEPSWLPGDANKDRKVSFSDYLILEANFAKTGATWAMGDFNNDGKVSFTDYLLLEGNFAQSIPEPLTLSLLLAGPAVMLGRRRQWQKSAR